MPTSDPTTAVAELTDLFRSRRSETGPTGGPGWQEWVKVCSIEVEQARDGGWRVVCTARARHIRDGEPIPGSWRCGSRQQFVAAAVRFPDRQTAEAAYAVEREREEQLYRSWKERERLGRLFHT